MIIEQSFFQPVDQILNDLDNEQEDYREFREIDRERERRAIESVVLDCRGIFNNHED